MIPVIGITCGWDETPGRYVLGRGYVAAVEAAGGLPLLLAYSSQNRLIDELLELLDGLLLSGGVDVDPFFFGQEPVMEGGEITPDRDGFEIPLCSKASDAGMPVLGICRGMQVLNIALGGDIYQDISSQAEATIKHRQQAPRWHPTHGVLVEKGTRLSEITKSPALRVNSFHHQAVKKVAPGFIVSSRAPDGIIESIENTGQALFMGVQWHPETMFERCRQSFSLFQTLIREAGKYKEGRGYK